MTLLEDHHLVANWIEENPRTPGPADVRIKGYCQSVWAVVQSTDLGQGDLADVAADFHLPFDAVRAALCYYSTHRAVIDARIASNRLAAASHALP